MTTTSLSSCLALLAITLAASSSAHADGAAQPGNQGALTQDQTRVVAQLVRQIIEVNCKQQASLPYCKSLPALTDILDGKAPKPGAPPPALDKILQQLQTELAENTLAAGQTVASANQSNAGQFAKGHGIGPVGEPIPPSAAPAPAATGLGPAPLPAGSAPSPNDLASQPKQGGADISLSAATDTNNASIAYSIDTTKITNEVTSLKIAAQTPISKTENYQNFGTLDGLVKSTSIGLQFNYIPNYFINATFRNQQQNADLYGNNCRAILSAFSAIDPEIKNDPRYSQNNKKAGCSGDILYTWIDKDDNLTASAKNSLEADLVKLHDQANITPIIDSLFMLSANAKAGYDQHTFYDRTSLDKSSEYRWPFQLGVAGTEVFDQGQMSATISYAYQKAYQDGGASGQMQVLCPASAGKAVKCVNGYIGDPLLVDKQLIGADFRYIASPGPLPFPIGVDPAFTYDAHAGTYAVQVPLYLVANSSKSLAGGIRYDWTSDKHESIIGVFVSTSLCLLPGYAECPK